MPLESCQMYASVRRRLENVAERPCSTFSDKLNVDHRAYATEGNARRALQVGMVALDDYFRPGERVDLLKLDVQGYELHALQGAKRIVNENREIKLLLEFCPMG